MPRIALLFLAALLALPAPASAARRTVPPGWLGVVADGPMTSPAFDAAGEWDRVAAGGAESVRAAVYWRDVQPAGAASPSFAAVDPIVLATAQRGLALLPVLQGTPGWAALHPGDPGSPPRDPATFGRFLTLLVERYGPGGAFWREHPELAPRPIRAWQVWNEPNITRYWNVVPWAPSYAALLKAAHAALRRADPAAKIVTAGLPNKSWIALRQIYAAGARGSFDVVGLHPYTGKPSSVLRLIDYARREMRRRHDNRHPIWITELSWPSAVGKTVHRIGFETTEAGQASRLRRGMNLLARARKSKGVGRVFWYTWLSAEGVTASSFDYSGLRRLRGGELRDTPALGAFSAVARKLEGCPKPPGDALHCA